MAGGKEMAWRLRIDFTDGTSELDDEIYETEDEAIDSINDWYEVLLTVGFVRNQSEIFVR